MFLINWGETEERLDPLYYLNIGLLEKNIVNRSRFNINSFKKLINMKRGRFGHRPRNDPRYYGGEYPFIQTGNIVKANETNVKIEYTQTLNELGLSTSRLFEDRVLVITIAANIGYTAILDYCACFPDSLVALMPKEKNVSLEYLNIYIRFIRQYIENLAPQAAQKNINLQQLERLPLIIPDIETQNQIVSIMDNAYHIKKLKEGKSQQLLDNLNDYLLEELCIMLPKKRESNFEDRMFYVSSCEILGKRLDPEYYSERYTELLNSIADSPYPKIPLSRLSKRIFSGKTPSSNEYSDERNQYPIIKVSSYKNNYIDLNSLSYSRIPLSTSVMQSDIFILSSAHQSDYVGRFIKFLEDSPSRETGFVGELICVRANEKIEPFLLFNILNLDIYKNLLNKEKRGQTSHIYPNDIAKIPLPVPDTEKQKIMVSFIKEIYNKIATIEIEVDDAFSKAKQQVESILLRGIPQ